MSKQTALCLAVILALAMSCLVQAEEQHQQQQKKQHSEQTTESPIADMALIEDAPTMAKTPTETTPAVVAPAPPAAAAAAAAPAAAAKVTLKAEPSVASVAAEQAQPDEKSAQPHTVADFIIHPLIAFKPRQAGIEGEVAQGKQASNAGGSGTSSTPGAWLFGMNPGQNIGSSFSTLAGSVSGWFNDRLAAAGQQLPSLPGLPGLVDTPVRDGASSTSTTSTTTLRPDIVVRVQQRPNRRRNGNGNGNGNLNGNGNGNGGGNRNGNRKGNGNGNGNGNGGGNGGGNGNGNRIQRPNRFNNRLDSLESDEYDDDYFNDNRYEEEEEEDGFDDDHRYEDDVEEEAADDDTEDAEEDEEQSAEQQPQQQQQQKRRRLQQSQAAVRRKQQAPLQAVSQSTSQRRQLSQHTRRGQPLAVLEQAEQDEEEDDDDDAQDDEEEDEANVEDSEERYDPVIYSQSTRRSQSQPGFIQNSQQSLINQLRRFTFGQTPAELGNKLRKSQSQGSINRNGGGGSRRPQHQQQATLLINRNGQPVYVAPELLELAANYPNYGYVPATPTKKQQVQRKPIASAYPQPPLTVPVRRKGRPTQYITIPWSQLGLSPPDRQSVVALGEGLQSQPLILNIPESAITSVPVRGASGSTTTTTSHKKKKRPTLTAAAVPLLADASLMDIFQPPQIPPSRTGATTASVAKPKPKPVLIAAKPVTAGGATAGLLPTRIRPGTIVEKAPAMEPAEKPQPAAAAMTEQLQQQETMESMPVAGQTVAAAGSAANSEEPMEAAASAATPEQEYILVGEDNEPGLSRHVQPVYGDARYVSYGDFHPYFDLLHQNRRFALRKVGRSLQPEEPEAQAVESPIVSV